MATYGPTLQRYLTGELPLPLDGARVRVAIIQHMMNNAVEVREPARHARGQARSCATSTSTCRPARSTGLLGPSGCGKTTLMRAIVGVQRITGGTVEVLGEPAGDAPLRDRIGYVTQSAQRVRRPHRRREPPLLRPHPRGRPRPRASACIETVGLGDRRGPVVGRLSGGQRSRVSLAVALLGEPDLLVLDEPTVGLDPVLRVELWETFHRPRRRRRRASSSPAT